MFKILIAFISAFAFGESAVAQCVPQQGAYIDQNGFVDNRPRYIDPDRGCYVPQGTPRLNQSGVQVQQTQQLPRMVPWQQGGVIINQQQQPGYWSQGYAQQQQGFPVRSGPAIPPNCMLADKPFWDRASRGAGEAFVSALIGGLTGAAIDKWRGTGGKWTQAGAAFGGAVGLSNGFAQDKVLVCQAPAPQQVVQADGSAVPIIHRQQQAHQHQQRQAPSQLQCGQGLQPGVLKPDFTGDDNGHGPGDTVCAKPGDTNISDWL